MCVPEAYNVPLLQTLFTYPNNFRACKVLIAAQYSGAQVKVVSEPPEFVLGETNKTSQFLEKFPLGKVPAFVTADGATIYESNAIAYYGTFSLLEHATNVTIATVKIILNSLLERNQSSRPFFVHAPGLGIIGDAPFRLAASSNACSSCIPTCLLLMLACFFSCQWPAEGDIRH